MSSVERSSSSVLALSPAWDLLPPMGNIDAYVTATQAMPMLTADEEIAYARRLRDEGDMDAACKLVLSHLRLVVSLSRKYLGYGFPHADLIQEGNVGLMRAVKRFDPENGARLATYATHWIIAEIHEYVLKNWRLVKVATTKAQRKLFFGLRSAGRAVKLAEGANDVHRSALSTSQVDAVAKRLNVSREDVIEMEVRLLGNDVSLDPQVEDGEDDMVALAPIGYLTDENTEPSRMIETRHRDWLASDGIVRALEALDSRSRRIVEQRWLNVNDDGSGGMTLQELANEYGVSAERIRQVEAMALKKMRTVLGNQR